MRVRAQGPSLFARLAQVPPGAADTPRTKPIVRRRAKDGHYMKMDRKTGRFVKSPKQ
jgi:hypothetical protein